MRQVVLRIERPHEHLIRRDSDPEEVLPQRLGHNRFCQGRALGRLDPTTIAACLIRASDASSFSGS